MRTTNELIIRGERANLERLFARVESRLHDGWKRDREAEERLGRSGVRRPSDYCFSCTAQADRRAAAFWVHARTPDEWYVSNVVPLDTERLNEEESHRLLAEFQREFLAPAATEVGVETELIQHRQTLEDDLLPEAARLLRAFLESANRTCLTPNDRRRWNAFLVRVHRDEEFFDAALLDKWLALEGWPEAMRCQLLGEYEAARSLLL